VPVDEEMSDWHLTSAWSEISKPVPIAGETFPSTEHLWGTQGVVDQTAYLLGAGIIRQGPVFVASPARAIADMVYFLVTTHRDPQCINVDQTPMTDSSRHHLVEMLRIFLERQPSDSLQGWIDGQPELSRLMAQPV
jgi:hypothetical protein